MVLAQETVVEKPPFNLTDLGNAERFIHYHGLNLLYCRAWKSWLIWEGTHWQVDDTGAIERWAKETVRKIPLEVDQVQSKRLKKAIAKHAHRAEMAARIEAMIRLARSELVVVVKPDEFDSNPYLLNCLNYTINLQTDEYLPHDREFRLMKQVNAEFDPQATCPTWLAFLDRIMDGNENLLTFLQRAVGYSLTGQTSEQVVFFLHGKGRNGKSTFLELLRYLLADYSLNTPTSTIMRRSDGTGAINNDVARLRGARLVTAVETEENQYLAESTLKSLTGQDSITARYLFSEFFEFKPEFKLWLACNHKPIISGTDIGIWRRIRMIPFTVTIPDDEIDMLLPEKLKAEASGIFNWALAGCEMWQAQGLGMPAEIKQAGQEYRSEMDSLALFFDDCCFVSPNVISTAASLYEAFQKWAAENGERPLTQRTFGGKLTERGFVRRRGTGSRHIWEGIGLRSDPSDSSD